MTIEKKILASVDQSATAESIADYAAWAAIRLNAPLQFLHVIDRHPELGSGEDHSGAIGVDSQQALLNNLTDKDAELSRTTREKGRIFLNQLRLRAIEAGVPAPDFKQRHGTIEESLIDQQPSVSLFVLGRNIETIVRNLTVPILSVYAPFHQPARILIAFDGSSATRKAVDYVATSPLFSGLPIHVLMSGRPGQDAPKQLDWAKSKLQSAGLTTYTALMPGDAEQTITNVVQQEHIGLLVMGAYAHSPLRALFFGSKTSGLLRSVKVPTLLVR